MFFKFILSIFLLVLIANFVFAQTITDENLDCDSLPDNHDLKVATPTLYTPENYEALSVKYIAFDWSRC